jgi:hypothetical protein
MSELRWLLSLLSPVLALASCFVLAVLGTHALDRLCPPQAWVSGACTAAWYPGAEQAAYGLAAFVGALLFVWLPAWLAPAQRPRVAALACGAGLTFTALFAWQAGGGLLLPAAAAVAGGLLALWLAGRPRAR